MVQKQSVNGVLLKNPVMPTRGRQTVAVKLLHSPSVCDKQFLTFWDEQLSTYIIFNQLLLHSPHRFFSICTIYISLCTVHAIVSFALLLLCSSSFDVHKTQIILLANWCLTALSAQKFPDDSLTVAWRFAELLSSTRHVKCYSYHACTSVTVSGGGRNAIVHDPKLKWNAQAQQSQK